MDVYCGSHQYWDLNLTWYSQIPDFTYCFQETALIWVPCIFLWLSLPFELYQIKTNKKQQLCWTFLNLAKFVLTLVLIVLSAGDTIYGIVKWSQNYAYPVDYFTPFIKLITFILCITLIWYHKKNGIHTSGIIFIFWLLLTINGIINYRSMFLMIFSQIGYNGSTVNFTFVTKMIYFPIVFCQFILSCFADIYYKSAKLEKNSKICPEEKASFLSIITFWWINPLIKLGFKKPLTKDDMWELSKKNKTEENVNKLNKTLGFSSSNNELRKKDKIIVKKSIKILSNHENIQIHTSQVVYERISL